MIRKTGWLILAALFTISCNETFDPLKERDTHPFTINGVLEYPSESSWIRVSEIRDTLHIQGEASIDANVTLEHLDSGETEVMKDSLVHYGNDIYAYNFGAAMGIVPEETYRITAERSDGQVSSVTATLPDTFPDPTVSISSMHVLIFIVDGIENMADVKVALYNRHGHRLEFPHRHDAEELDSGRWRVRIDLYPHLVSIYEFEGEVLIPSDYRVELYIASAGPGWIDFVNYDPLSVELPETSNVENGSGYVIGVTSKMLYMTYLEFQS